MVKLKCDNCGGELEVNSEQDKIFCQYCGAKILIDDEASEIRRVEEAKLQARKKNHEQTIKEKKELDEIEDSNKFKKGKLGKIVIVFTIICLLFVYVSFNDGQFLSVLIGIIQIVCLSVGWLSGMKIINEKFKGMHTILIIIGFALTISFLTAYGNSNKGTVNECDDIDWKSINLNDHLAEYQKPVGYVSINSDTSFMANLCNVNKETYRSYVEKTKEFGFNIDSREYGNTFLASSKDGYNINMSWDKDDKELYISLTKKEKDTEISDNTTTVDEKKNEEIIKEENTKQASNNNELRSDFKKAMDSYEEYIDEYVEFMNKYNNNSSDYKLIMEYAKVMKKYNDMNVSFEKWKDENLNAAETAYYIEVQTRVNEKLASVIVE